MRFTLLCLVLFSFCGFESIHAEDSLRYDADAKRESRFVVGKVVAGIPEGIDHKRLVSELPDYQTTGGRDAWFAFGDEHSKSVAIRKVSEKHLYIDLNRDQKFTRRELLESQGGNVWETKLAAQYLEGGDTIQHNFNVRIKWNEVLERFELLTLGAMVGTAKIDGETRPARYIDRNSNGHWFDSDDRFEVDVDGDGEINAITERFACRSICRINKKQFAVAGHKTGQRLNLHEISDTGFLKPTLKLSGTGGEIVSLNASLASESGIHIQAKEIDKPITCPVGEYRVESLSMTVKDENGVYGFRWASLSNDAEKIVIGKGKTEPFDLTGSIELNCVLLNRETSKETVITITPTLVTKTGLYLTRSTAGKSTANRENRCRAECVYGGEKIDSGSSGFS